MSDSKNKIRGRSRGPQARGERTRSEILEAALRLIARRGAGSLRTREVASEAGISLGVLTYHFPTREALLTAAFVQHLEQTDAEGVSLGETQAPEVLAGRLDLDSMTDQVMAMLRRMVHDDRDVFLAGQELTLEMIRNPALSQTLRPAMATHRETIEALMAAVGSDTPALDGELLSATFEGLGLKWIVHGEDPEFEKRLRDAIRRLLMRFGFGRDATDSAC